MEAPLVQFGKYQLVAELDRGGMGVVHLAVARGPAGFSKLVVIKQLKPELKNDLGCREMFIKEARIGAALTHPNIVQTYEVVCEDDAYFTVMEYMEGPSLKATIRALKDKGLPTQRLCLRVLLDVLKALEYAHSVTDIDGSELKIVHRDVTPHNIIITYDGQVKLFDFGIAKAGADLDATEAGVIKGKPPYMAPEQAAGEPVDSRTDLFAVGVMLWEALAERRLWAGKKESDVLRALFGATKIPLPGEHRPDIDPELESICMRALAPEPKSRYQTARELHDELEARLVAMHALASTRDLAAAVTAEFAGLRAERRARVEARVARAMQPESTGSGSHRSFIGPYPDAAKESGSLSTGNSIPVLVPPTVPPAAPELSPRRKRAGLVTFGVVALFAVATAGAFVLGRSRTEVTAAARTEVTAAARVPEPVVVAPPPQPVVVAPPPQPAVVAPPPQPAVVVPAPEPVVTTATSASSAAPLTQAAPKPRFVGRWSAPPRPTPPPQPPPPPSASAAPPPPQPVPVAPPPPAPPPPSAPPPIEAIPRPQINAAVRAHRAEVERCVARARMDTPDLAGRVNVQIRVQPDGHVSGASAHGGSARLESCLEGAIRDWTFPPPAGGVPALVAYTFVVE